MTVTIDVAACFCGRTLVRASRANSLRARRAARLDVRHDARAGDAVDAVARAAISPSDGACAPGRTGGRFDRRPLGIERQRRAALAPERLELAVELRREAVPAERLDQELQPVALLVLVVAEAVEDAHHRLGDVEHLGGRQELVQQRARRAPSIAVPPPTVTRKPRAAAVDVRDARSQPMSLIAVDDVIVGQPSNAILNLRGSVELSGWRSR